MSLPWSLKNKTKQNVISGVRYVRNSLYPIRVTSGRVVSLCPVCVISGIRYIRCALDPVCVNSRLSCVIVEGDSLELFTAQM